MNSKGKQTVILLSLWEAIQLGNELTCQPVYDFICSSWERVEKQLEHEVNSNQPYHWFVAQEKIVDQELLDIGYETEIKYYTYKGKLIKYQPIIQCMKAYLREKQKHGLVVELESYLSKLKIKS